MTATKKQSVKRKGGQAGVDWFEARKLYLSEGEITYEKIAKKFGVSTTAVFNRAKAEKWIELKADLNEKAFNAFTEKLLDTKSNAQNRHLTHWQNLQALCNNSIREMAEHSYYTDRKGNIVLDTDKKPIQRPLNPFELEKLSKALKVAIDGERVVLGLPTSVSALSDPDGGNVWSGFSDMVKAAEKVLAENGQSSSGGDT